MKKNINITMEKKEKLKNDIIMSAIILFTIIVAIIAIFFIKPKKYGEQVENNEQEKPVQEESGDDKEGYVFEKESLEYDGKKTTLVTKVISYEENSNNIKYVIEFYLDDGTKINEEELIAFAGDLKRGEEIKVTSFFTEDYSKATVVKYKLMEE